MTRFAAALAAALATGALLVGCGGSNSSPTTAAAQTTGAVTGSQAQAAVRACRQAIQAESTLPSAAKSKLEAVCPKAVAGDREAVKQATREVCAEIIEKGAIPEGPDKQAALRACKVK